VIAAREVSGLVDTKRIQDDLIDEDGQPVEDPEGPAVLCTLRQEKEVKPADGALAWWTCGACPQPRRWLHGLIWNTVHSVPNEVGASRYDVPSTLTAGNEWQLPYHLPDEGFEYLVVQRCKRCERMRARHHRAKVSLGQVLQEQILRMGTSARFVTLTVPNADVPYIDGVLDPQDLAHLVRELKSKMYKFSRTVRYQDKVLGAVEFYEQTFTPSESGDALSVNTHIHAVWLGDYWKQEDLQDAWGGIVHITRPRSVRSVMKYISKYVTKDPVEGTRAKETRGVLRGR